MATTRSGNFRLYTSQPQQPAVHSRHARAIKPLAVGHPLMDRVQLGMTRHDQPPSVGIVGLAQRSVPGHRGISRPAARTALEPVQGRNEGGHKQHHIERFERTSAKPPIGSEKSRKVSAILIYLHQISFTHALSSTRRSATSRHIVLRCTRNTSATSD